MPELKPAYLIHGDDHGAVGRAARGAAGAGRGAEAARSSVEVLEGDAATPAGVAEALAAMTLAIGRRVIVVDGVERWRAGGRRAAARAGAGADAAGDDARRCSRARRRARRRRRRCTRRSSAAGGQVVAQMTVKPWELPKWVREQAARIGLSLDAAAAKALVAQVGERQQRLLRELEKLALEGDAGERATRAVDVEDIERARRALGRVARLRARRRARRRRRARGDALLPAPARAGRAPVGADLPDGPAAARGARGRAAPAGRRVRRRVKRGLRMPPRAAERFIADVARSDPERLRAALGALADLELDSRGGAVLSLERDAARGAGRGHARAARDRAITA